MTFSSLDVDDATTGSSFLEATEVVVGARGIAATAYAEWSVAGVVSGGYLLAIAARAAEATSGSRRVVSITAQFLRPPRAGLLEITIDVLRRGRAVDQLQVALAQDGSPCVIALATMGELDDPSYAWMREGAGPPAVPLQSCNRMVSQDDYPARFLGEIEMLLDEPSASFLSGSGSSRGILDGWLRIPGVTDGRDAGGAAALLFALDAFPPATFDVVPTGWVPTIGFSAYILADAAPGPLQIRHRANTIGHGRATESCDVWDSDGTLVASATQLASFRTR